MHEHTYMFQKYTHTSAKVRTSVKPAIAALSRSLSVSLLTEVWKNTKTWVKNQSWWKDNGITKSNDSKDKGISGSTSAQEIPLPEPMLTFYKWGSMAFNWVISQGMNALATILYNKFENHNFRITAISLRGQWVKTLTHWGLVMPYGDRDLGQHWLR